MLSLIIPLHNDGKRLLTNWNKLYSFLSKYINDFEIILAEDGSIDNTYEICKKLHRKYHNVKISHYKNKLGRGLAIKKACKICKGKYIGYIDSDMATDISFILDANKLLKTNDVVIGSRYIEKSHTKRKKYRLFMSFVYNYIVKIVLHNNVYDNQCGFKFFKRDTILKLNKKSIMNHWSWDTEIIFLSRIYGYKIKEMGIVWEEKSQSKVKVKDLFDMFKNIFIIKFHKYR